MTYALAAPLQAAVYDRLTADPAMAALVGGAIFDAPPPGPPPALYVSLGPEEARAQGDKTGQAAQHRFVVTLIGETGSFHALKALGAAVETALTGMPLALSRGRVVDLRFEKASARRARSGTRRRIEMTFRALVDDV